MKKKKIKIKNLRKSFNGKEVLRNINLDVFESESLAVIGESGCGKSVLTKCIIGLLEFELGEIIFNNTYDIKKITSKKKIDHISKFGVLFQNAALFDSLSIRENILFQKKKIDYLKVLNDVGLNSSVLSLFPSDLSAGMQKRVGLARAILARPEILILDEPTTGLDPIVSDQINKLLRKLVVKNKLTTITITHDMESVYQFADKVAFINNGSIFWYGDVKEISLSRNKYLINFINGKT